MQAVVWISFTLLVLAHPGSPGQNPVCLKTVVVVVQAVEDYKCLLTALHASY